MFARVEAILAAETSDLRSLAAAAGADPRTFWRGADLDGVDLRGQDLRDLDLTGARLEGAIVDERTLLPAG